MFHRPSSTISSSLCAANANRYRLSPAVSLCFNIPPPRKVLRKLSRTPSALGEGHAPEPACALTQRRRGAGRSGKPRPGDAGSAQAKALTGPRWKAPGGIYQTCPIGDSTLTREPRGQRRSPVWSDHSCPCGDSPAAPGESWCSSISA